MFTVSHLTKSFLSHLAVRVKTGAIEAVTREWYRVQLDKLVAAAGQYPAAALRADHLVNVEFSNAFVRCLKACYAWACDDERDERLLERNPFRKLTVPQCGERQRVLTREEMCELYRASSRRLRRFLFVMIRTIARPGEVRKLTWGHIHWDRRLIILTKFKGKKRRKDGVKVRTFPLDRPTLRLLRNIYEQRGRPGPDAPVWLDRNGQQWSPNGVRCQMRAARVRAGLDPKGVEERVVCYHMRHTGATTAVRNGMDIKPLADIMGHARITTTERYLHLAGNDLVDAIDKVSSRPRPPRPRKEIVDGVARAEAGGG